MRVYATKNLFGILVIASVNRKDLVILVSIETMKIVSAEKKLVDKLVAECTENIDEVKIAEITSTENVCVCSYTICVILLL